jgi:hypothetical protein
MVPPAAMNPFSLLVQVAGTAKKGNNSKKLNFNRLGLPAPSWTSQNFLFGLTTNYNSSMIHFYF